ncbi:Hatching enzyme [Brachionus plicatilis]|uniref:Hatching enzyme n=1 Tax=Brachionus plicatilis TaxID=10195 RepID=A0A3M7RZD9_BRAPC|nr:Hatching enzyme [Brachionus plicatilis]
MFDIYNIYVKFVSKWNKKRLTYAVLNQNKQLKGRTNSILAQAVRYWGAASGLSFRRVGRKSKRDMAIRFAPKAHGDGYPFDGRGGVLAHAFFPQDGRIHFDADERWTDKSKWGINLKIVAVHEFGHALGLDHTTDIRAVMYPFYQGYNPKFRLGADDIRGIQFLYGKNKK